MTSLHLRKQCCFAEKLWKSMSWNIDKVTVTIALFAFWAYREKSFARGKIKSFQFDHTSTDKTVSYNISTEKFNTVVFEKREFDYKVISKQL